MLDAPVWLRFLIAALATWRISHLLANEDGPADIIVRFRRRLGDGVLGQLMDCFYCVSIWVAAPIALTLCSEASEFTLTWLSLSGGACLLNRIGQEPGIAPKGD